jgi:hypothetical protein
MTAVRRAAGWLWDFLVGDDPITAAGVVIALGLTALIAAAGAAAWWVMPVAVVALLARSLRAARRPRGGRQTAADPAPSPPAGPAGVPSGARSQGAGAGTKRASPEAAR